MLQVNLLGSPQDENSSGDSGEKVRADSQLLGRAIARVILKPPRVFGLDQLGQINVLKIRNLFRFTWLFA
jgi:hypothetical protein